MRILVNVPIKALQGSINSAHVKVNRAMEIIKLLQTADYSWARHLGKSLKADWVYGLHECAVPDVQRPVIGKIHRGKGFERVLM